MAKLKKQITNAHVITILNSKAAKDYLSEHQIKLLKALFVEHQSEAQIAKRFKMKITGVKSSLPVALNKFWGFYFKKIPKILDERQELKDRCNLLLAKNSYFNQVLEFHKFLGYEAPTTNQFKILSTPVKEVIFSYKGISSTLVRNRLIQKFGNDCLIVEVTRSSIEQVKKDFGKKTAEAIIYYFEVNKLMKFWLNKGEEK